MNKWLQIRLGTNMKFYDKCTREEQEYILRKEIISQVGRKRVNLYNKVEKNAEEYRILQVIERKWENPIMADFKIADEILSGYSYSDAQKEAIWKVWLGEIKEEEIEDFINVMYNSPDELLQLTKFSIEEWW